LTGWGKGWGRWKAADLLREVSHLRDLGVDVLRIGPQPYDTEVVVDAFRAVMAGEREPSAAEAALGQLASGEWSNGFWYGRAGMVDFDPDWPDSSPHLLGVGASRVSSGAFSTRALSAHANGRSSGRSR